MCLLIEIDGSVLEGGGQILRTSIALSSLLEEPLRVSNIRVKRKNPGLRPQHLMVLRAFASLTGGSVRGDKIGSRLIEFFPGKRRSGRFKFDIGTAGSISLFLQALLPCCIFAPEPVELTVLGGTNVAFSPQIDYLLNIFCYWLNRIGIDLEAELVRRGTYPRGGGEVKARVKPVKRIREFTITERGNVEVVRGISWCERLPSHVVKRQGEAAMKFLLMRGFRSVYISSQVGSSSRSPGSGIVLWAETNSSARIGADALGERGKRAELVGEEASGKLLEELSFNAPLDSHMADQIIPFMALSNGFSRVKVTKLTLHVQTNIYVTEKILGVKFYVKGKTPAEIGVKGVGYSVNQGE